MVKRILIVVSTVLFICTDVMLFAQTSRTRQPTIRRITINLTGTGYRPASFRLKKGVRTRLTFIRKTDATCGQVIVIPAYGVQRDLPLNQPVDVTITPRRSGTFAFTCGMDMLRGKIIVY